MDVKILDNCWYFLVVFEFSRVSACLFRKSRYVWCTQIATKSIVLRIQIDWAKIKPCSSYFLKLAEKQLNCPPVHIANKKVQKLLTTLTNKQLSKHFWFLELVISFSLLLGLFYLSLQNVFITFSTMIICLKLHNGHIITLQESYTLYALAEQMDLEQLTHRKVTEEQQLINSYVNSVEFILISLFFLKKNFRKELEKVNTQLEEVKAKLEAEKELRRQQEKESLESLEEWLHKETEYKLTVDSYQQLEQKNNILTSKLKEELNKILEEKYLERGKVIQKENEIDELKSCTFVFLFATFKKCLETISKLTLQLHKLNSEQEQYNHSMEQLSSELQQLKTSDQEHLEKITDLTSQISQTKALQYKYAAANEKISDLDRFALTFLVFAFRQNDKDTLENHEILLLENNKMHLKNEIMELSVQNTSLTHSLHSKEAELEEYKANSQTEKEGFEKASRDLEETKNIQIFEYESKLLQAEKNLETLKGLEDEVLKYTTKCSELEKQLEEAQTSNCSKTNAIQKISAEMATKENEVRHLKINNLELMEKCSKLQQDKDQMTAKVEIQSLTKEHLMCFVHQLHDLSTENAQLKETLSEILIQPERITPGNCHTFETSRLNNTDAAWVQLPLEELQKWRHRLNVEKKKEVNDDKLKQDLAEKITDPDPNYSDFCTHLKKQDPSTNNLCNSNVSDLDFADMITHLTDRADPTSHRCCNRLQHLKDIVSDLKNTLFLCDCDTYLCLQFSVVTIVIIKLVRQFFEFLSKNECFN
ncbi:hypothetical protein RFI_10919 [Reticulomyxa filosa]|uniref:Viral A-type inclusion protein n=1 Tax=Reticulomyxa filosa TaxID=46433 RepID=X6NLF9_RETFI|nr:hypothetical protein RFI_10919 [Reticulomyxa filosa]|eukprot:ETO26217.1 hypothetical protein RFI_10919 [Reticulomyxa filosa]